MIQEKLKMYFKKCYIVLKNILEAKHQIFSLY